jgi:hypothetical protein
MNTKRTPFTGCTGVATSEGEIRKMEAQSQAGQVVLETLSQKYTSQKRTGRVAQG